MGKLIINLIFIICVSSVICQAAELELTDVIKEARENAKLMRNNTEQTAETNSGNEINKDCHSHKISVNSPHYESKEKMKKNEYSNNGNNISAYGIKTGQID